MAYACFNSNGYSYHESDNSKLFYSDNTHESLFDYVKKDLSKLPVLFERLIFQRLNVTTMELVDSSYNDGTIEIIKAALKEIHPYYEYEWKKAIINEIGIYFNTAIRYQRYKADYCVSEQWYLERIECLLAPFLSLGDSYPMDFYNAYKKEVSEDGYTAGYPKEEMEYIVEVPSKMPVGFSGELNTQRIMSNLLYFILDIAAKDIGKLTTGQRVCLYSNIFYSYFDQSAPSVAKRLGFYRQQEFRAPDHFQDTRDFFVPLSTLSNLNIGRDGIPENMLESFTAAVNWAGAQTQATVSEEYEIDNLQQLLFLEIMQMAQAGTKIRKCKNCGKYFVVSNRKIVYCNRIDESGKCCSDVGPSRSYLKKMREEEARNIYNRAYKTHYARLKNGNMDQNKFRVWCDEAKEKLEKVRVGKLDIASFQEWLKK